MAFLFYIKFIYYSRAILVNLYGKEYDNSTSLFIKKNIIYKKVGDLL